MANWYENEELMRSLGDLGMGLLVSSGPSTDPSHRSFGSALGKGLMQMTQGQAARKADARANRAIAVQEEQNALARRKMEEELAALQLAADQQRAWKEGLTGRAAGTTIKTGDDRTSTDYVGFEPSPLYKNLPADVRLALASMPAKEGGKEYQDLVKWGKPEPMTIAPYGVVMGQSNALGQVRAVPGAKPLPKFGQSDLGGVQRIFNEYDINQFTDWTKSISPSVRYQVDHPPNAIMPVAGGGLAAISTRGTPTAIPVMPRGANVGAPQDQPLAPGQLPVTSSGAVAAPETVPAAVTEKLAGTEHSLNVIARALGALKKAPEATGLKGVLPDLALQRLDPEGATARADIADIGSLQFMNRSGMAVTVGEAERTKPFIPLKTDPHKVVEMKLKRLSEVMKEEAEAYRRQYRTLPNVQPAGQGVTAPTGSKYGSLLGQ